jgi:hypothetical protein
LCERQLRVGRVEPDPRVLRKHHARTHTALFE